jgi:hypothetical protein
MYNNLENLPQEYTKLVKHSDGKYYLARVTKPAQNSAKRHNHSKLTKRTVLGLGLSMMGIYVGSIVAHPLDGLRNAQEYGQTLIKVGQLATDKFGITNNNDPQANQQEQSNE